MKRFFRLISALIITIANLYVAVPVKAHETDEPHNETTVSQAQPPAAAPRTYDYVTPKGCSLTLLVRKSLQLYDEENQSITLTQPGTVFAETNIVQRMGSRLLNIGEQVNVSHSLVEEFATKSTQLSEKSMVAWARYARRANFNLAHITPATSSTNSQASTPQPTEQQSTTPSSSSEQPKEQPKAADQNNVMYWWIAAGASLVILYYLFSGRTTVKQ